MAEDMAAVDSEFEIWKKIDLSESYMVCCMFEEAASLAASVVKKMRATTLIEVIDDTQLADMMESAGMVFVQSLKELGRTRELFDELKVLFGSVAAIPVQVFLSGACMQISEGYSSSLRTTLEEFFETWVYLKDEATVLPKAEMQTSSFEGCLWQATIPLEQYLEAANLYAITVLGKVLHKPQDGISWTERAGLPEEKRQDMLRNLHLLHLAVHSSSSPGPRTTSAAERNGVLSAFGTGSAVARGESLSGISEPQDHLNLCAPKSATVKSIKPSIEHISNRTVGVKFGNFRLVLPRGKIFFLGSLMLFIFYMLQKRRAALKRFVARQASSLRRALMDAWKLAFSVQVNPLAAVQQLPSPAPRGSR